MEEIGFNEVVVWSLLNVSVGAYESLSQAQSHSSSIFYRRCHYWNWLFALVVNHLLSSKSRLLLHDEARIIEPFQLYTLQHLCCSRLG